jgi:transcriptional regulator with XRE-family HTH domain
MSEEQKPKAPTFLDVIRRTREVADISQETVAAAVGISRPMYSRFEAGEADIDPSVIFKIKTFLDSKPRKKMQLSSLLGTHPPSTTVTGKLTEIIAEELEGQYRLLTKLAERKKDEEENRKAIEEINALEAKAERVDQLESENEKLKAELAALQESNSSQKQMIEGYRKFRETDLKIIELLQETGPGSAAMEAVKMLEHIEKLLAENAELRSWLNAEEQAAMATEKAAELRERVTVTGMRKENTEEDENG